MAQFETINTLIPRSFRKTEYNPYADEVFESELRPVRIFGIDESDEGKYLKIDASVNQVHDASVEITRHPVELGADITDFAIINPRVFEIEGRISQVKPKKENAQIDENDVLISASNRVESAWDILEDTMRNRLLVTIETNLKIYENLLIRSISASQDAKTVRVLDFKAMAQEIILTQVKETELTEDQIAEGSKAQAAPNNNRGEVGADSVADSSESSILKAVTE